MKLGLSIAVRLFIQETIRGKTDAGAGFAAIGGETARNQGRLWPASTHPQDHSSSCLKTELRVVTSSRSIVIHSAASLNDRD